MSETAAEKRKRFWSTKSSRPEFHAVVFSHPAMSEPIRLVANQFAPVTLGGFVHTPAPMQIKPPDQGGDVNIRMTISFPRAQVGRQFKAQLKLIEAWVIPAPIKITYSVYLGETDTPQVTWPLFAGDQSGIQFTAEAVQVTATDTNPMRRSASEIYTPDIFTGIDP